MVDWRIREIRRERNHLGWLGSPWIPYRTLAVLVRSIGLYWHPLIKFSCGKVPLLVWNKRCQQEFLERPQAAKNVHSSECPWRPLQVCHALTEKMRNLYDLCVGRKTINNRLVARSYSVRRILPKPLLTADHRRLCLDRAQSWQNLTVAAWSHVIWGDESHFSAVPCRWPHQGSSTAGRTLPARLADCQGPKCKGFCPCLGVLWQLVPACPSDKRPLSELGSVTNVTNQPALEIFH